MVTGAKETATVDAFLKTIVKSGLVSAAELDAIVRALPKEQRGNARDIADQLVKRGKLSSFQAQKLLKGAFAGLILGPYEVMAPIGKGGMGTVYLARDRRSQKLLALKVLPPKRARQEERMLVRFRRELDISKKVNHPNIALTFEGGEIQNVFYIAMEFIPGKTLSKTVADKGPLTPAQIARVASEVCLGLHYAHGLGIIHRDLKPSNIMITPGGQTKLLDLGLALVQGEVTEAREVVGGQGYVVGSMDYIAPEQIADAVAVDARADIYGLGCTMFFALTGRPPFPGGSAKDKMRRHRREQPPSLRELNPSIPEPFAAIVHRMMAKSPADRFPDMLAVREALLPWAVGAAELPMDQSGERSFQEAVRALQVTEVPSEMMSDSVLDRPIAELADVQPVRPVPPLLPTESHEKGYVLMVISFIGFWVVLLLILGLILLFRGT